MDSIVELGDGTAAKKGMCVDGEVVLFVDPDATTIRHSGQRLRVARAFCASRRHRPAITSPGPNEHSGVFTLI